MVDVIFRPVIVFLPDVEQGQLFTVLGLEQSYTLDFKLQSRGPLLEKSIINAKH